MRQHVLMMPHRQLWPFHPDTHAVVVYLWQSTSAGPNITILNLMVLRVGPAPSLCVCPILSSVGARQLNSTFVGGGKGRIRSSTGPKSQAKPKIMVLIQGIGYATRADRRCHVSRVTQLTLFHIMALFLDMVTSAVPCFAVSRRLRQRGCRG